MPLNLTMIRAVNFMLWQFYHSFLKVEKEAYLELGPGSDGYGLIVCIKVLQISQNPLCKKDYSASGCYLLAQILLIRESCSSNRVSEILYFGLKGILDSGKRSFTQTRPLKEKINLTRPEQIWAELRICPTLGNLGSLLAAQPYTSLWYYQRRETRARSLRLSSLNVLDLYVNLHLWSKLKKWQYGEREE